MKTNYKTYDFEKSLERVDEILNSSSSFEEKDSIPLRDDLTFTNGFYVNCSAIFIDLRDSSRLPSKYKRPTLARIYRSYISEIVAVLNGYFGCKEVNIVGDCVSAIFNAQYKHEIEQIYSAASRINTLIGVMNYKLCRKEISPIKAGIGLDFGRALMIKAGYKGSTLNEVVWMGDVVNQASKLCSLGNKKCWNPIIISSDIHSNLPEKDQDYFAKAYDHDLSKYYYHGNIVDVGMDEWIESAQTQKPCTKSYE